MTDGWMRMVIGCLRFSLSQKRRRFRKIEAKRDLVTSLGKSGRNLDGIASYISIKDRHI